jgi:hypothetical protein
MESKVVRTWIIIALLLMSMALMANASTEKTARAPNSFSTTSAPPPIEWNKTYGEAGDDVAYSVVQTSDGGYALAGYTNSSGAGGYDFWLVKTDSGGNMQWNQTYGGLGNDYAYSVVQTSEGGYALAGYTNSSGAGGYDFWLVKTDSGGNMQWSQTYGGAFNDVAYSVVQTSDGGYALAGSDFWLVKTDSGGNMQWSQTYGGVFYEEAYSVVQTSDGGYALAGYTYDGHIWEFWLVKTNSSGDMQWNQAYGRATQDMAYSVVQTSDGGYALAGYAYPSSAGGSDSWLVKTNSSGDMQWNQTYEGGAFPWNFAYSLCKTSDGGYALAGTTSFPYPGRDDFWLVKTDSGGNMQWNQTYGGALDDVAYSVVQTSDGGYALAGYTNSYGAGGYDFYLVKARSCTLTITVNTPTGGTTSPLPGTYSYSAGTVITVNATPYANYLFDHWVLDGVSHTSNPINVTMNTDHSLQAFFTPSYNLTINATAGGTTNPTPGTYVYSSGTVINVTASPDTGYLFEYWVLDGVSHTSNPINVTMNTDHSLQAFFTPSYNLTINATAGGTTNPTPGTYVYSSGTVINVTASPDTGYHLYYWELDSKNVGAPNPINITMNTNHQLKAVFVLLQYTITINATTGGTTSPSGTCIYPYGYVVNVTASPDTGYYLYYWELDSKNVGAPNPINITMNTNHQLMAVFALLHHDVAVTNVTFPKTVVCQGFNCCDINVTVTNQGSYTETFNVTAYVNDTDNGNTTYIDTSMNVTLAIYTSASLTFNWNTTGFEKGNYTIIAYAEPVLNETNVSNNNFTSSWIRVTRIGDLNYDDKCDGRDLMIASRAFASYGPDYYYPGSPATLGWNPNADITNDNKVDGRDLMIMSRHFGEGT